MHVPVEPRFRPSWLGHRTPPLPAWLDDERLLPEGDRRVHARARTGLYAALERREFGRGATALLPAFVSCAVADACRAAGLSVATYPVERDLSVAPERVVERIETVEPAVVAFNHYFGFPDPAFDHLASVARSAGAVVVEDCARGLFGRFRDGRPLGSTGDIAIFSLRKVLPVPNGGLVVADDLGPRADPTGRVREWREAVESVAVAATRVLDPPVDPWALAGEAAELGRRARAISPAARDWSGSRPGRLTRIGLARTDPRRAVAIRQERYRHLRRRLADLEGVTVLTPPAHAGACPYGVAIRFSGGQRVRDRAFARLRWRGVPAQVLQWPSDGDRSAPDDGAVDLRESSLVVGTHQQVPERALVVAVEEIAAAVEQFRRGRHSVNDAFVTP